jgi:hypothetical protein
MEWMKSEASLVAETAETRQHFFVFLRFFCLHPAVFSLGLCKIERSLATAEPRRRGCGRAVPGEQRQNASTRLRFATAPRHSEAATTMAESGEDEALGEALARESVLV